MASRALMARLMIGGLDLAGRRRWRASRSCTRSVWMRMERPKRAAEQVGEGDDGHVEVGRRGHQALAAGEGEELAGELAAAFGGLQSVVDEADEIVLPGGHAAAHEVERADDGGEQVVEVVRDAAGELADGLEFLGLAERRIRLFRVRPFRPGGGCGCPTGLGVRSATRDSRVALRASVPRVGVERAGHGVEGGRGCRISGVGDRADGREPRGHRRSSGELRRRRVSVGGGRSAGRRRGRG
jgi:hypothetical protein